ncbi:MAG TPA: glutamate mutase L [Dermatophilaceae bacterium]
MTRILCVDFGSTYTKAVLLDPSDGNPLAAASVPTTIGTDVLDGYRSICQIIAAAGLPPADEVLACSSAGGGLRLAVVGYERSVTAEAGHRVGLSAGAKIVHVASGPMTAARVAELRANRPDVILLVGGTDGGNAEVLLHNGARLARARLRAPVVVAGNVDARAEVGLALQATGRRFILTDNVLPQIGVINPDGARAAIREMFLRHVIGGKHLSKGPRFASMVRAATPDAMLRGVETLAAATDGDVLVFDIGGATTDVYSVISPEGEDATLRKEVVAPLWHARTVEGDLGMRWNARGVVEAARVEQLLPDPGPVDLGSLQAWAERVEADPAYLPVGDGEVELDLTLARVAALTAVRRHARPARPGDSARPLARLAHVIGSGGVLRHSSTAMQDAVLRAVTTDVGGGWKVPTQARTTVDSAYLLFAAGLLADAEGHGIEVAARVAARVLASGAVRARQDPRA